MAEHAFSLHGEGHQPTDSWAAGSVALTDDDGGSAQFSAAGIVPGQGQTHCVAVTYNGSVASAVTLYATASAGSLAAYLNLTAEEGTGGGFGSCTGFRSSAIDYAGTVAAFASSRTSYATGAGFFVPSGSGQPRTYRFTTTLDPSTPDSAQSATASLDLRWQAQNSGGTPLIAFGGNNFGQLGTGDYDELDTAGQIGSATNWVTVADGTLFSCATRADGTLWCTGQNDNGQLGDGTTTSTNAFNRVGSATDWASVAAGDKHACAIKTDGTLWCWGKNADAQLGQGDTTERHSPTQVGADTTWMSVAASRSYTCGLKMDGTLWCWGDGDPLHYGDSASSTVPAQVGAATTWTSVATGGSDVCATRSDGSLWCWGDNENGETGTSLPVSEVLTPTQVSGGGAAWSSVTGEDFNMCAARVDRTVWCWGPNDDGENGTGDSYQEHDVPTQATGVLAARLAVGTSSYHTHLIGWTG